MKIPLQNKIAELERRIEALEKQRGTVTTKTTVTTAAVDLEPEMRRTDFIVVTGHTRSRCCEPPSSGSPPPRPKRRQSRRK